MRNNKNYRSYSLHHVPLKLRHLNYNLNIQKQFCITKVCAYKKNFYLLYYFLAYTWYKESNVKFTILFYVCIEFCLDLVRYLELHLR